MSQNSTLSHNGTARVVAEHKTNYTIRTVDRDFTATVRGKFHTNGEFPKVGDFVQYSESSDGQAVIEEVLPRKSVIVRDASERSRNIIVQKPQIIATNVDLIFIVMALDADFNIRRLERYLLLATQSNIRPVIILNKSDIVDNLESYRTQVGEIAPTIALHCVSALTGTGMDEMLTYFAADTTAVLLGSSGAGKSTITNWLLEQQKRVTGEVAKDTGRGKHTTTSRELFDLPFGGFLIDTPGMRELGMYGVVETSPDVFADVEELIRQCQYTDCDHEKSEGCAVQEAITSGVIDAEHFVSYKKLIKEREYQKAKALSGTFLEHKQKVKRIHKQQRKTQQEKYHEGGFE